MAETCSLLVINNDNDDERWRKWKWNGRAKVPVFSIRYNCFALFDGWRRWQKSKIKTETCTRLCVLESARHRWKIDLNRLLATEKSFSLHFFCSCASSTCSHFYRQFYLIKMVYSRLRRAHNITNYDCSLQIESALSINLSHQLKRKKKLKSDLKLFNFFFSFTRFFFRFIFFCRLFPVHCINVDLSKNGVTSRWNASLKLITNCNQCYFFVASASMRQYLLSRAHSNSHLVTRCLAPKSTVMIKTYKFKYL